MGSTGSNLRVYDKISFFGRFLELLYGTSANSVFFYFDTSKIVPLLFLQYSLINLV